MMSDGSIETDWIALNVRREAYRQQLIKKGVIDGSNKMHKLMARKERRGFYGY